MREWFTNRDECQPMFCEQVDVDYHAEPQKGTEEPMDQKMKLPRYVETESQKQTRANNFTYHAPHGDQADRYADLRELGSLLAALMNRLCPPSRELSLAMTNLEQAVFWANAAIARNEKDEAAADDPVTWQDLAMAYALPARQPQNVNAQPAGD